MKFRNANPTQSAVLGVDMIAYLATLGYQPTKIKGARYWYLSPLHSEHTPSFQVNSTNNSWYDHTLNTGGDLLDFVILYQDGTVGTLSNINSTHNFSLLQTGMSIKNTTPEENRAIHITSITPLRSPFLMRYLLQRRIPLYLAQAYLKEVHYTFDHHLYKGIGIKNNSGGYEIRSPLHQGHSIQGNLTLIQRESSILTVFESFFDFLSLLSIHPRKQYLPSDILVLHHLSLVNKARHIIEAYHSVHLYLSRTRTGQNCTRYLLSLGKKYRDKSSLYARYKDLNEWLMHIGKSLPPFP